MFRPVMLVWFLVIGLLGLLGAALRAEVAGVLEPQHAIGFLRHHGWRSFAVLGGVFLAITGGEALHADMGHIGRDPICSTWYYLMHSALLLSYAGQTARLIENRPLGGNPYCKLAPGWPVIPLVLLATLATMICRGVHRNAVRTSDRFGLPADKVLEIGRQIAL